MVRSACDRLLNSGCPARDIVLLTLYAAQVNELADNCGATDQPVPVPSYRGVRVAVLDNFQGREQRVAIVSLVRSDADGTGIGFVAAENRVCVLLSRARAALFMFGNLAALAARADVWRRLDGHLRGLDAVGEWTTN